MRRTPAEVNAALASATLVAPFMRFKVPMAVFSKESVSCCPWVSIAMSSMRVVRLKAPRLMETSVCPDVTRLVCVCVFFYYTPFSSVARGVCYLLQRLWFI